MKVFIKNQSKKLRLSYSFYALDSKHKALKEAAFFVCCEFPKTRNSVFRVFGITC